MATRMFPLAADDGRKLYERGPGARGPVVDRDSVALGPSCSLVEYVNGFYRVIEPPAAALLLSTVFDYEEDPRPFLALCHSIAKALCDGNLLRAQLLGLQIPVGPLGPHHLARLDNFARMAKAGFDPNQPRAAKGEWGGAAGAALPTARSGTRRSAVSEAGSAHNRYDGFLGVGGLGRSPAVHVAASQEDLKPGAAVEADMAQLARQAALQNELEAAQLIRQTKLADGTNLGKMGTVTANPKLNSDSLNFQNRYFTSRLAERSVSNEDIKESVRNPLAVLSQNNGQRFVFIGDKITSVVENSGRIITGWSRYFNNEAIKEVYDFAKE